MATKEARRRANEKWNKKNRDRYERLNINLLAGRGDIVREAAREAGQSASAYVWQAVEERMERDKKKKGKAKAET